MFFYLLVILFDFHEPHIFHFSLGFFYLAPVDCLFWDVARNLKRKGQIDPDEEERQDKQEC